MPIGGEEGHSANKACLSDYPSARTESNALKALLDPVNFGHPSNTPEPHPPLASLT